MSSFLLRNKFYSGVLSAVAAQLSHQQELTRQEVLIVTKTLGFGVGPANLPNLEFYVDLRQSKSKLNSKTWKLVGRGKRHVL